MRQCRILYEDGPGDAVDSLRRWLAGERSSTEVNLTCAGEFFDTVRELSAEALVYDTFRGNGSEEADGIRVVHHPVRSRLSSGWRYHLGEVLHGVFLSMRSIQFRAGVIVLANESHWFSFWPSKLFGVKIVTILHCAFWPVGHRRKSASARLLSWANGWFWRRAVDATLCVSPEVERQLRQMAGQVPGQVFEVRLQYNQDYFAAIPPVTENRHVLRVLFAGRLSPRKGIFDLLKVATALQLKRPGEFVFEICGDGPAMEELKRACRSAHMEQVFKILGRQDVAGMAQAYGRSHVIIVPTTSQFAEGLNRVCVEGVLAHRPVVTSRLCHAIDVLGSAIVEVPEDDPASYANALEKLKDDADFYQGACHAAVRVEAQFFDREQGLRANLVRAIRAVESNQDEC